MRGSDVTGVIGPIFYETAINTQRYRDDILAPFFEELTDIECQSGHFQQDSATAHTGDETLNLIQEIFEGRIISRELWSPRSPDLFAIMVHMKNNVYATNLDTLEELKPSIVREIDSISEDELMHVNAHFLKKMQGMCG